MRELRGTRTAPGRGARSHPRCTDESLASRSHPRRSGTGFDLADLARDPFVVQGKLDLVQVSHARWIDGIGNGSTFAASAHPIHEPDSTPYSSGGFDSQAVGVRHLPEPGPIARFAAGARALFWLRRGRSSAHRR
jgi:hypothetical protein